MKHVTKLQGTIFIVLLAAAIFLGAYILYNEFSGKYDTDAGPSSSMLQTRRILRCTTKTAMR